ncbi:tRNA (guanosine(46)-N7)-methyltransferase TrmB, partial [Candidatus Saccharibacteria bacterium]
GHFLLELARRHPEKRFVAIDVKADRLYAGARDAIKEGIANIIFIRSHVSQLETIIPNQSLNEVWVTFSDPYPKGRQAKHRLTHPHFLAIYQQLLVPEGLMHFKTDNLGLFHWSLEQFIAKQLQLSNLTFDLHQSNSPDEYKIMTTYERRFVAEGLPIYAVDVSFGSAES